MEVIMRTRNAMLVLLALLAAVVLSLATAQTSEGVAEAISGTSAGSAQVFMAFIEEHDPAFYAEDAVFHVMALGEPFHGRAAIGAFLATLYGGAFTDTHVEIRTLLADGNRVVLEFVYNGTNTGEFMGSPATDRRIRVPMLGIYEIEGELIRYGRLYYDAATIMRQLGHLDQE
jgi:steroid delta-isomerase-like uncharacterized protein